jgi:CubicO group peptidase (beta-lactamase class C family)
MTALCAHRLIERGELDLDAPVARYWPEFAAKDKGDLPVRWLLSHQAGLPAVRRPLPTEALYDWSAMAAALAEQEPWWEPGTRHGYHALTFGFLVGEVIRRASGRSVGTILRDEVAGPLGADFFIGLPAAEDARTSPLYGSLVPPQPEEGLTAAADRFAAAAGQASDLQARLAQLPGPLAQFMRDMTDPTTMTGAAFNNPPGRSDRVNTRAWRGAEIPAANGHGTAEALARIYGALARGGALGGVRLLEPASIELARTEQVFGPDAVLGGLPMRFGLGFMLRQDLMPISPNPNAFGHPGAGGSIGMADPDAKLGFGYVTNKMKMGLVGGPGAFSVLRAFFDRLQ